MSLQMDAAELMEFLNEVFPQVQEDFAVEGLSETEISMRLCVQEKHLRPGGTVSGPSMFALADCAAYAMVLARIGRKALAVTTSCSMDFMRKPVAGGDLIATCKLLKLGRSLAVCDILIHSVGQEAAVARASMTYSIPPTR
ncbi:PaaI family thioesterase [Parasedimentitalea psychrophila]|uniref:PaaI family thioesterase n=1 Tax=Parasedimentitalea psychrophila TaxID=2997337 RepID=A0A9Y2KXS8_9RHOB|nr:PaaI family thioesterase [Parasedimentitalea psychrophila]WIY24628.1 PaaI family thioesterase [Parasedimentitalea psychrophila]